MDKSSSKFRSRVELWSDQPLGLQYDALVYNTFAMSVLGYVAQLEVPPRWLVKTEAELLRKAAKGPGSWFKPTDLWCLRESFGLARSFVSLEWLAQAAQLRVKVMDVGCRDQSKLYAQAKALRGLLAAPEEAYTRVIWSEWYAQSFVLRLEDNYLHYIDNVYKIRSIYDDIGSQSQQTVKMHSNEQLIDNSSSRKHQIRPTGYDTNWLASSSEALHAIRTCSLQCARLLPPGFRRERFTISMCLGSWYRLV